MPDIKKREEGEREKEGEVVGEGKEERKGGRRKRRKRKRKKNKVKGEEERRKEEKREKKGGRGEEVGKCVLQISSKTFMFYEFSFNWSLFILRSHCSQWVS